MLVRENDDVHDTVSGRLADAFVIAVLHCKMLAIVRGGESFRMVRPRRLP